MKLLATNELAEAVAELRALFPEMRMGQLVLNIASAAGVDPGGVWDVEDETLLVAARRLLERNRDRT